MVDVCHGRDAAVLIPWTRPLTHILRLFVEDEGVECVVFDDVAALFASCIVDQAHIKLSREMQLINMMESHGLTLVLTNTEVVALTNKTINTAFPVRVEDEVV